MKKILLSLGLIGFVLSINAQENKIESTGSVGIGTISPSSILDVEKNHNGTTSIEVTNNNTGSLARRGISIGNGLPGNSVYLLSTPPNYNQVSTWANAGILGTDSQLANGLIMRSSIGKIRFQPGGTSDKIVFTESGDVGIGTITPLAPLSVKSNSISSSNSGFILEANNSNNALVKIAEKSTNGARLHMYEEGIEKIAFYTDGTNNHISAGNLGIGTSNPDMKLTVKGNIHAEEVKIDLNVPAPDYVFKENYKLRTIEELEKFIKQYSHLPEIPSAKEFEQNGIMQAEMDMNLLKKIEELTLYTIAQEKKIKELESLNKKFLELQSRLEELESKK